MTAGGADSFRRDQHPRADDYAFVNRIAQCNIDKFTAGDETTTQVAHRGKSRFDGRAGKGRRADRVFGNIQIKLL